MSRQASCSRVALMPVLHHSTATTSHANSSLPVHLFYAATTTSTSLHSEYTITHEERGEQLSVSC